MDECKLNNFKIRKEIDKNYFTKSVVNECNKLKRYILRANTIKNFRWKLDIHIYGWKGRCHV